MDYEKLIHFWQGFNDARENHKEFSSFFTRRAALPRYSMDLAFGSTKFWPTLRVNFDKSKIYCRIWIVDEGCYYHFKRYQSAINDLMGCEMVFTQRPKTYSIDAEMSINVDDERNWPRAYQWMMDMAVKTRKVKDRLG